MTSVAQPWMSPTLNLYPRIIVLWSLPNVVVTPHIANTPEMGIPLLAAHIRTNVRNWISGSPLEGLVDPVAGY